MCLLGEAVVIGRVFLVAMMLISHFVCSWAHVSIHAPIPFIRPKLTPRGEGDIILEAARHPCLEMQDVAFIDNDVEMRRGLNWASHLLTQIPSLTKTP